MKMIKTLLTALAVLGALITGALGDTGGPPGWDEGERPIRIATNANGESLWYLYQTPYRAEESRGFTVYLSSGFEPFQNKVFTTTTDCTFKNIGQYKYPVKGANAKKNELLNKIYKESCIKRSNTHGPVRVVPEEGDEG